MAPLEYCSQSHYGLFFSRKFRTLLNTVVAAWRTPSEYVYLEIINYLQLSNDGVVYAYGYAG
jgi:hypothetical protein